MLRPKKNSYKELDNEKKFLRLKNSPPPPPLHFSNGPSLIHARIHANKLLITAQPIRNLRTPASAEMNKRGFL